MLQIRPKAVAMAAIAAAMLAVSATVQAIQQRSFVSGDGLDTSPCTLTAPCRSFGAAIAQTLAGGEVIVLDSAGYGPVLITGPISIIAPAGVYAGISVSTGVGVTINAGGTDVVVLRGLDINGIGGTDGIVVGSGLRVVIDRCTVSNFPAGSGLLVNPSGQTDVDVTDTLIRDNQIGVSHTGSGILNQVTLSRVRLASNGTGVSATGVGLFVRLIESAVVGNGSGNGLFFNPGVNVTVRFDVERSQIIGNNVAVQAAPTNIGAKVLGVINETLVAENGSFGIVANANAGATATLSVSNSTIRYNGSGLRSQQAGSTIVFRNNRITDHGIGLGNVGGALLSGQGNLLHDNTTPGLPTGTIPPI